MLLIFVDLLVLRVEKLKTKRQLKYFFGTLRPTLKYIYCSLLITFLSHVALLGRLVKGSWPGCPDSMKSRAELNSGYSHDKMYKFSLLSTHVVLHYEGKILFVRR